MPESTRGVEYVCCNLCGGDDTRVLYEVAVRDDQKGVYGRDVWPIVQCRRCRLVYANPRLDAAALAHYYTFDNAFDAGFVQEWFIDNADLQQPTWRRLLRAMGRYRAPGRLLDVGCGAGTFLVEARRAGYDVSGQEVSPFFVDYCRREHGLAIFAGEIETIGVEPASLDFATAFDVVEHHPDPHRLLREMRRLLKPGGLAAVSTHDIGNFFARRYGARWRHINPVGHLTYFTRQSLAEMLRRSGFRIVRQGGLHTIDGSRLAEIGNGLTGFARVILLRAAIIGLYRPLAGRFPRLAGWRFGLAGKTYSHQKLLTRSGSQIVMNDDMVILAVAESSTGNGNA
jgi:SAM-dependent methyltransferase